MSPLRERLAQMTDDDLLALVDPGAELRGWGASGTVHVDGVPVFLKRLLLSDVEDVQAPSTKNWFRLPVWYSYGVGSAGFSCWREVATHEMTSGVDGFPTLLHARVLPRTAPAPSLPWTADEYVAYWRGSRAVGDLMRARSDAQREVWVLLEHVPMVAFQWLLQNQSEIGALLADLYDAIDRLGERGIVHFDAHLGNVVTDGTAARLTDFGLAMADSFELSASERRFLDRHRHYDHGTVLASLGQMLMGAVGTRAPADLARAIDERAVPYAPELWAVYDRYRAPMLYMVEHFARMMRPTKRSTYDDAEMARLLRAAGKISR